MSNVKDPSRVTTPTSKDAAAKPSVHSSGRPTFDSRGNAIWEWQTEDGEFSTDINTQRLRKLEAPELSIEETGRIKKRSFGTQNEAQSSGFNPYDHGTPNREKDPYAKRHGSPPTKSAEPRKPVKDLKRLQEWMEMKKRLADQKED